MNQTNVEALAAICEDLVREHGFDGPNGPVGESWWEEKDFTEMGEFLASRGCLVPSALTDEEVGSLGRVQRTLRPVRDRRRDRCPRPRRAGANCQGGDAVRRIEMNRRSWWPVLLDSQDSGPTDAIIRANQMRNRRVRWHLAKAICAVVGHHWENQRHWKMCARCAVSEWLPGAWGTPPYHTAEEIEGAFRAIFEETRNEPLNVRGDQREGET